MYYMADAKKRPIQSFQADPDVERMLERARAEGRSLAWLCNQSCREWLKKEGYARKRDLTEAKAA